MHIRLSECRFVQAVQRGAKLIVVDPRDIDLCKDADIHLKLKPGTNVAFANGMMHIFIEEDLIDHKFIEDRTENFEAMKEMVKDYTPEKVAEICQIDADMLREAARIYAKADGLQLCTVLVLQSIILVQKVLCPFLTWL